MISYVYDANQTANSSVENDLKKNVAGDQWKECQLPKLPYERQ